MMTVKARELLRAVKLLEIVIGKLKINALLLLLEHYSLGAWMFWGGMKTSKVGSNATDNIY